MHIPDMILCDHMHETMVNIALSGPKYHLVHSPVTKTNTLCWILSILPGDALLDCMLHHTRQKSLHRQAHDAFQQDSPARKLDKLVYNTYLFLSCMSLSYLVKYLSPCFKFINLPGNSCRQAYPNTAVSSRAL